MDIFNWLFRPPSEAEFAAVLVEALRQAGDLRPMEYDAAERRLLYWEGDDAGTINLVNLHTTYCQVSKKERSQWLTDTCTALLNQMDTPTEFDDVKPDLLPALRSCAATDFLRIMALAEGEAGLRLPSIPLSDFLNVSLVYDLPKSMRFVLQDDLDAWGITLYEAMEVARRNLDEHPPAVQIAADGLHIFRCGDGYDATRMLSLDYVRGLKLKGSPVAMPLNRDFLIIAGSTDDAGLGAMAWVAREECEGARPVCSIPHLLCGDEWQPWSVPPDHPAAEEFRLLKLHHFGSEYAEQKPLLEKLVTNSGIDVFVATYSVGEIGSERKLGSYCVWTKGVRTWLPMSDAICLFDRERDVKALVPWEKAATELGPMMKRLDYWPPRWFVEECPEDEWVDRMAAATSWSDHGSTKYDR